MTAYEAVEDYSVVAEHEGLYIMDRTIREVLADNCPMIIVDRTIENAIPIVQRNTGKRQTYRKKCASGTCFGMCVLRYKLFRKAA